MIYFPHHRTGRTGVLPWVRCNLHAASRQTRVGLLGNQESFRNNVSRDVHVRKNIFDEPVHGLALKAVTNFHRLGDVPRLKTLGSWKGVLEELVIIIQPHSGHSLVVLVQPFSVREGVPFVTKNVSHPGASYQLNPSIQASPHLHRQLDVLTSPNPESSVIHANLVEIRASNGEQSTRHRRKRGCSTFRESNAVLIAESTTCIIQRKTKYPTRCDWRASVQKRLRINRINHRNSRCVWIGLNALQKRL
mmetsp:Transcript_32964/g.71989  ORF Transcript_32964/g.71989 Transcript_32964/m.71989 type:complete len:248 (-) Transcript_32964:175-918(-)